MSIRLGIFVSHPVQYHTPIWRKLASYPDLDVKVHFFSDHSVRGGLDKEFGVNISWDTPILEGYEHVFLKRDGNYLKPLSVTMSNPEKVLREGRFDVILIAGYVYSFEIQLMMAARKLGIKIVMRGEFTDLKGGAVPLWKKLVRESYLKWVYSNVDAFGVVGKQARKHLTSRGIHSSKMFFSPYSVDTETFDRQKEAFSREETRKELGLDDDTFAFLFSGKLMDRKQIVLLVEAFAHLPNPEKAALIILGDGEQREEVVNKGKAILGERFLFQGFVNQTQLGKYYLASDAFVLPSKYEAWGLVVNEAMQFGLPLLLSDMIGSHQDLLTSGETGYLFKTGDVHDLARGLQKLMDSPEKSREMGKRGEEVIENYSTTCSTVGLYNAIQSLF